MSEYQCIGCGRIRQDEQTLPLIMCGRCMCEMVEIKKEGEDDSGR